MESYGPLCNTVTVSNEGAVNRFTEEADLASTEAPGEASNETPWHASIEGRRHCTTDAMVPPSKEVAEQTWEQGH